MLPRIYEQYVATGHVELIFLDLPLQMHPHAFKAAEAAHCAGDQEMFWDMHHMLFAYQNALAPENLVEYATELGLDVEAFKACLKSGSHAGAIRDDARLANRILKVTGTPAWVFGRRVPETDKVEVLEVIKGLGPYEAFEEKIKALLDSR